MAATTALAEPEPTFAAAHLGDTGTASTWAFVQEGNFAEPKTRFLSKWMTAFCVAYAGAASWGVVVVVTLSLTTLFGFVAVPALVLPDVTARPWSASTARATPVTPTAPTAATAASSATLCILPPGDGTGCVPIPVTGERFRSFARC
jgi:hypothetical protein